MAAPLLFSVLVKLLQMRVARAGSASSELLVLVLVLVLLRGGDQTASSRRKRIGSCFRARANDARRDVGFQPDGANWCTAYKQVYLATRSTGCVSTPNESSAHELFTLR
jgi:hypothetical protein